MHEPKPEPEPEPEPEPGERWRCRTEMRRHNAMLMDTALVLSTSTADVVSNPKRATSLGGRRSASRKGKISRDSTSTASFKQDCASLQGKPRWAIAKWPSNDKGSSYHGREQLDDPPYPYLCSFCSGSYLARYGVGGPPRWICSHVTSPRQAKPNRAD